MFKVTDPTTTGLVLSYLMPLQVMIGALIYPLIHITKSGVSIQRLKEYADWKIHEKPFFTPKAPENWPSSGRIQGQNVSVRYRKGLPLVLDGVNYDISPGEKVAIIGRTGSGNISYLRRP